METINQIDTRTAQEVYQSMLEAEPGMNPVFTAVRDIKDVDTAKLFLEGCAEQVAIQATDEVIRENPLITTYDNVKFVADYYSDVQVPNKTTAQQYKEMLEPWAEAYKQLTTTEQN